jgi:hypothetical protein
MQSTTGPQPPPWVEPKQPSTGPVRAQIQKTLPVPGYRWRHGCGPTVVGMVLGYYDMRGYRDLFPGGAYDQTPEVDQCIASHGDTANPRHYEDYSLPMDSSGDIQPDKSEDPPGDEHTHDSIADFMETSWSSRNNRYGWSWSSDIGPAFRDYTNMRNPDYGPSFAQYRMSNGTLNWSVLTREIDAGCPMIFLVDTGGDNKTDHFVTVIGYRDQPSQQYGCLDTWTPVDAVRWCDFAAMANGQSWGIAYGWSFSLEPQETHARHWQLY